MPDAFIVRRGCTGGKPAYGFLFIEYHPSDADLVVTNVQKNYEQISEFERLYYVNKPDTGSSITCVATITKDGETQKSASVTFDAIGQSKSLLIEFRLTLLPPTTGWETSESTSKVNIGNNGITFNWSANNGQAHTAETIDLTGRSTLCADFVINEQSSGSYSSESFVAIGLLTDKTQTAPNWTLFSSESIHQVPAGTELTVEYSLPSGVTDQYYVAVGGRYTVHATCTNVYAK